MTDEAADPWPIPAERLLPGARLAAFWLYVERPVDEICDDLVEEHRLSVDEARAAIEQARRWLRPG